MHRSDDAMAAPAGAGSPRPPGALTGKGEETPPLPPTSPPHGPTDEGSGGNRLADADADVACPFCSSSDTEVVSPFGSQLLTSQRRCRACRSYFEALRDDR